MDRSKRKLLLWVFFLSFLYCVTYAASRHKTFQPPPNKNLAISRSDVEFHLEVSPTPAPVFKHRRSIKKRKKVDPKGL